MMRGTLANIRIKNKLIPGIEGGFTIYQPSGEQMAIWDAAEKYMKMNTIDHSGWQRIRFWLVTGLGSERRVFAGC